LRFLFCNQINWTVLCLSVCHVIQPLQIACQTLPDRSKTLICGEEPRRMLKIIISFCKHCSSRLQAKYWKKFLLRSFFILLSHLETIFYVNVNRRLIVTRCANALLRYLQLALVVSRGTQCNSSEDYSPLCQCWVLPVLVSFLLAIATVMYQRCGTIVTRQKCVRKPHWSVSVFLSPSYPSSVTS
jgi:hypothetical protein